MAQPQALRLIVSTHQQRAAHTTAWLLLVYATFIFSHSVMGLPLWGSVVLSVLETFIFFFVLDRSNPRTPVPFLRGADYISRVFLQAAAPLLAIVLVYVASIHFKFGASGSILPVSALIGALIVGAIVFYFCLPQQLPQVVGSIVRGRPQPVNSSEVVAAETFLPEGDTGITWGGLRIPSKSATTHFLVVGTTGSGKTVTIRLLMQEVLKFIGTGADARAIVYDAKQDAVSVLAGMGLKAKIKTFNPFDKRCVAWDIAKDIIEPATALQAAVTLLPQDEGSTQPFFVDAAQNLAYGVMIAFILRKSDWRFSDLIRALQNPVLLEKLLRAVPETEHIATLLFGNRDTLNNVMSTVSTKLLPYEAIAALWDHAAERVSLNEWVKDQKEDNSILILGNSEKARRALDALNRAIFKRCSDLILDEPENRQDTRRTWVFFDEIAEAGKLDGLTSLLTKGRSKGACVMIGFQEIDGLKDVYGAEQTSTILGQCNNKAILRIESPTTGEWASKLFGSYEAIEVRKTETKGKSRESEFGGKTQVQDSLTLAEEYVKRESVLESQFAIIPTTNRRDGLTGYYIAPGTGTYQHTYGGDWLFGKTDDDPKKGLADVATDVLDIEGTKPEDQYLRAWKTEDYKRLNFLDIEPIQAATPEDNNDFAAAIARGKANAAELPRNIR